WRGCARTQAQPEIPTPQPDRRILAHGHEHAPTAHRFTDRRDPAAWLADLLRREIDRAEDVVRLVLAEAPAQAIALAMTAHLEEQHRPAVGQQEARDATRI